MSRIHRSLFTATLLASSLGFPARLPAQPSAARPAAPRASTTSANTAVRYRTVKIDGLDIFYREAGPQDAPVVLLLHGFPTSSHMFRNLILQLADRYHVVAPDYPGFGHSAMPAMTQFEYRFDRLAQIVERFTQTLGLARYTIYVQDYGAPVGFRLAAKHPERIDAIIVQNGNAYEEGLSEFWNPIRALWKEPSEKNREAVRQFLTLEGTKWQYTHGVSDTTRISPDNWTIDQRLLDRPGNKDIQLALVQDYGSNPPLYAQWQAYFRKHQPPMLVVWGKNDLIFPAPGALAYKRDLPTAEVHLLDTGHFALEEKGDEIARLIRDFLAKKVERRAASARK